MLVSHIDYMCISVQKALKQFYCFLEYRIRLVTASYTSHPTSWFERGPKHWEYRNLDVIQNGTLRVNADNNA